jgi:hypothetical protein
MSTKTTPEATTPVADYCEAALRFVESDEVRDYLREISLGYSTYCDIICNSRASLSEKAGALDLIASQVSESNASEYCNPTRIAAAARRAIELAQDNTTPGAVFMLIECWQRDLRDKVNEDWYVYSTFEAAHKHILTQATPEYSDEDCYKRLMYRIEKHVPATDGLILEKMSWELDFHGNIVLFRVEHTRDKATDGFGNKIYAPVEDELKQLAEDSEMLNGYDDIIVPVPFVPGDIVTIDLEPYHAVKHVLITSLGDNRDCCAVQCFYINDRGRLDKGAFNHYYKFGWAPFPAILRAKRYYGKLPKREAILGKLSEIYKQNIGFDDVWGHTLDEVAEKYEKRGKRSEILSRDFEEFAKDLRIAAETKKGANSK